LAALWILQTPYVDHMVTFFAAVVYNPSPESLKLLLIRSKINGLFFSKKGRIDGQTSSKTVFVHCH